jgi:hypothetical protein
LLVLRRDRNRTPMVRNRSPQPTHRGASNGREYKSGRFPAAERQGLPGREARRSKSGHSAPGLLLNTFITRGSFCTERQGSETGSPEPSRRVQHGRRCLPCCE